MKHLNEFLAASREHELVVTPCEGQWSWYAAVQTVEGDELTKMVPAHAYGTSPHEVLAKLDAEFSPTGQAS